MSAPDLFLVVFIALGFAIWPVIGKYSQATGPWVGTVVGMGTGLVVAAFSARRLAGSLPTGKAFTLLIFAAIMNGAAVYLYARKTSDPTIPTGIFMVGVSILLIIFAPLLDWGLNGSVPTTRQMAGLLCGIVAVYLLRR